MIINETLFGFIKKKWWIVLLCAILGGLALAGERYFFAPRIVVQSGNIHMEKMIKVTEVEDTARDILSAYSRGYGDILLSYGELYQFQKETESDFQYEKFNANWPNMREEERLNWLQKRLFVNRFIGGVYQFIFVLKPDDAKDDSYAREKAESYLDRFVSYGKSRITFINEGSSFQEMDHLALLPEERVATRNAVYAKYGAAGVILGALVGVCLVIGYGIRKQGQ